MSVVRLYYNKSGPFPWSVDEGGGDSEQQVKEVLIMGVNGHTREAACTPKDPERMPAAWLEYPGGKLRVVCGVAVIYLGKRLGGSPTT